ncbi:MAG: pantoate--beta-alanine ligase [Pseudobacteriovorax sp.]|nr:pantoate--beta-alanine ligase [Pseudobacteriovorax sp.]
MKACLTSRELIESLSFLRSQNDSVGFVPTMGALHRGHLSLIEIARKSCTCVVASIFVNPKQFGPDEDFATYPRTVKEDLAVLEEAGVDFVFLPSASDLYPEGFQTGVSNQKMSRVLCGQYRDGHFDGVLTVVAKLFGIVKPQEAFFGKKDYQQYLLIRRMVEDLSMGVKVMGCPIIREEDGLAMSSRNRRLSDTGRIEATAISKALTLVRDSFHSGENRKKELLAIFHQALAETSSITIQYCEIRDAVYLEDIEDTITQPSVMAVAVFLEGVRLIDNVELGASSE